MLLSILLVLIALLVLISGLIVLLQDLQVIPALLMELELAETPDGVERFSVPVEPGVVIEVWRSGQGIPLLFLHGNGDTVESFVDMHKKFAGLGFSAYQFDYRGVGRSTGWPSEQGLYRDAESVIEFIAEREKVSTQDIVVVGQSLGSGPTCYIAEKYRSRKVAIYTPYTSLPAVVRQRPLLQFLAAFVWYKFPNKQRLQAWIDSGQAEELLLIHGRKDQVIRFSHSEEILKELRGLDSENLPKMDLIEESAGTHDQVIELTWEPVAERLNQWREGTNPNTGW